MRGLTSVDGGRGVAANGSWPRTGRLRATTALLRFVLALALVGFGAETLAQVVEDQAAEAPLTWYDETTQLKVAQMETLGQADTVVVGTSMAWQGLVPDILEQQLTAGGSRPGAVYNAGLAGGVPVVTELWLTDEVLDVLEPQRVIWALSSIDFSDVYGDAGLAVYQQAPATRQGWLAAADRSLRDSSALFRQRSRLRDPSELVGEARSAADERMLRARQTLGPDGERLDFDSAVTEDRALEVRARISPFVADRDDLAAIVRTIEELQTNEIEVILVELPVPPRFLALYDDPAQHEQSQTMLKAISSELSVPLVQVAGEYGDADFVDFTHLDRDGAARFSAEVAQNLLAMGFD